MFLSLVGVDGVGCLDIGLDGGGGFDLHLLRGRDGALPGSNNRGNSLEPLIIYKHSSINQ